MHFFSNEKGSHKILEAMGSSNRGNAVVDAKQNRFPYSIVFQPFPPLSWVLPTIGHMGITDSKGRVIDFQGPYAIVMDSMMLGPACVYVPLDPKKISNRDLAGMDQFSGTNSSGDFELWDRCVARGAQEYSNRFHNLICDNCNHHVARTLNIMGYANYRHWGMFQLWVYVLFNGKCVGWRGFMCQYGPFLVLCIGVTLWAVLATMPS